MAGPAFADNNCLKYKDFTTASRAYLASFEPEFDFTRTKKTLTKDTNETRQKWAKTEDQRVWIENGYTAGLAKGRFGFRLKANSLAKQYGGFGSHYLCPFFKNVEIEIFYGSILYVVKEFPKDSCRFKTTLGHEFSHHDTNLALTEKYVARLNKDLPVMLQQVESYGYVPYAQLDERFELMRQSLRDAIDIYMEEMHKEMEIENGKIDTL
ncbi:MAG: hypothetical protein HYU57_06540, partial [Micavibrio aeruginosavorus]|nr:hypothetical protein [Micavibrio aeruginosavorus]